jgi:mono/diheme cytochrome c family protein
MPFRIMCLLLLCFASNGFAADAFEHADAKAGKKLLEKHCIACHASSYGGDGSEIYTREYHKVKTSKGLLAQVRACNTNLDLKLFDEEEQNVAAYLNQTYYHFDR